jgi:mono/diheme cytochrome c family protein
MNWTATNIVWTGGLAGVLVLIGSIAAGCNARDAAAASPTTDRKAQVERGGYLVKAIGCNDCHTPMKMGSNGPEYDMSRMLSGHPEDVKITDVAPMPQGPWANGIVGTATGTAFSGPWGVSFTANLTPDQNTGLGIWTEDMFVKAIRTGKHYGVSRPILPPMPWPAFRHLTDDDLKAVFAYLRTIPPVVNHVPDPIPPPAATTN